MVDTALEPPQPVFFNRILSRYPAFSKMTSTAWKADSDRSLAYPETYSAKAWKRKKQILYLLGPVGGSKSYWREKLKIIDAKIPIYRIKGSPVNNHPFACLTSMKMAKFLNRIYGI